VESKEGKVEVLLGGGVRWKVEYSLADRWIVEDGEPLVKFCMEPCISYYENKKLWRTPDWGMKTV